MYKKGGLISVTSRILVVDLLQKDIPVELITGMVILHAEKCVFLTGLRDSTLCSTEILQGRITPTSLESFIVRLYRTENKVPARFPVLCYEKG